jgi:hypothetical protein
MRISDQEVWLRAYCSCISNYDHYGSQKVADRAVEDFNKRFPKFEFVSEEGKKELKLI